MIEMMKKRLSIVYIFIFLVGSFCKMSAREVTLFNDGWEFKKGRSPKKPCRLP